MKIWAPFLLLCVVMLSNRLLVDDPDMSILGFDSISYLEIARAAPDLTSTAMPHQHAQRLVGPWVVGTAARVSPLSLEWTFEVVTFCLLLALLLVTWKNCEYLGASKATSLTISAMLAFNPYLTRFYFSIPTYVGDLLFLVGLALLINSLLRVNSTLVLLSLFVAAIGRQTSILLLPTTCLWIFFQPDWKSISITKKTFVCGGGAILVAAVYLITDRLATIINPVSINAEHVLGLFHWIADVWNGGPLGLSQQEVPLVPKGIAGGESAIGALAAYFIRGFLSLAIPVSMIFAATGIRSFFWRKNMNYNLFLFTCLMICSQPILAGPSLTGHPVVRLGMLCLPALALALVIVLKETKTDFTWGSRRLFAVIFIFFISSLHHRYTAWGGSVNHAPYFAAFYFACAIATFFLARRNLPAT